MTRRRPFRATAFVPDPTAPNGRKREVAGRVAAASREGLDRFVNAHRAAGHEVDVVEILPLPFDLDSNDLATKQRITE